MVPVTAPPKFDGGPPLRLRLMLRFALPQHLLQRNIYSEIASPLKGEALREVSLAMLQISINKKSMAEVETHLLDAEASVDDRDLEITLEEMLRVEPLPSPSRHNSPQGRHNSPPLGRTSTRISVGPKGRFGQQPSCRPSQRGGRGNRWKTEELRSHLQRRSVHEESPRDEEEGGGVFEEGEPTPPSATRSSPPIVSTPPLTPPSPRAM